MPEANLTEVEEFAQKISNAFHDVTNILATAELCNEAQARITDRAQRRKLFTLLPFSKPKFSKFVTIGAATFLRDPAIRPSLPANYSILYDIARMEKREILKAIAEGKIHLKISRVGVEGVFRKLPKSSYGHPAMNIILEVKVEYPTDPEQCPGLWDERLNKFIKMCGTVGLKYKPSSRAYLDQEAHDDIVVRMRRAQGLLPPLAAAEEVAQVAEADGISSKAIEQTVPSPAEDEPITIENELVDA